MSTDNAHVHVSGHGSSAELLTLLQLVRPKHFMPIHGEWRHLRAHAGLANAVGVTDDLKAKVSAVDLLKAGVAAVGGQGGGGRPDMAQGGGPNGGDASKAIDAIRAALQGALAA